MSTTLRPIRKLAMVLAVAGAAGLGTVVTAPAALAAEGSVEQDGSAYVVDGPGHGRGPAYFIVTGDERIPVFFCDDDKPNKRHNNCLEVGGPRF